MIQKILKSSDIRLRQISKPVAKIDKKIASLIKDLKDTLGVQKDPEGVGLAAPQIGKNLRIFLVNHRRFERVMINPIVLKATSRTSSKKPKRKSKIMEGCLSLPHYYGPLARAQKVKVGYLNEENKEIVEEFEGFPAQIVLHEIDHLNGILFVDRIIEQKKKLYKLANNEWEEMELE